MEAVKVAREGAYNLQISLVDRSRNTPTSIDLLLPN